MSIPAPVKGLVESSHHPDSMLRNNASWLLVWRGSRWRNSCRYAICTHSITGLTIARLFWSQVSTMLVVPIRKKKKRVDQHNLLLLHLDVLAPRATMFRRLRQRLHHQIPRRARRRLCASLRRQISQEFCATRRALPRTKCRDDAKWSASRAINDELEELRFNGGLFGSGMGWLWLYFWRLWEFMLIVEFLLWRVFVFVL